MFGHCKSWALAPRQLLVALCLLIAGPCLSPLAAGTENNKFTVFNPQLSAPQKLVGAELKKAVGKHFAALESGAITPAGMFKDRAEHAAWVKLRRQLGLAIDAGHLQSELADYGITPESDGGYAVDVERFPHWVPLDGRMRMYLNPGSHDWTIVELKEAGFSDSDSAALRDYLANQPYPYAPTAATGALAKSFATRLKRRADPEQRIDRAELLAYRYQLDRNRHEASRVWVVNLLESLSPDGQKILETTLMSWNNILMGMTPSNTETELQKLEAAFLSDKDDETVTPEFQP